MASLPLVVESVLPVLGSFSGLVTLMCCLAVSVREVSLGSSYSTVFLVSFLSMVLNLRLQNISIWTSHILSANLSLAAPVDSEGLGI